MAIWQFPLYYGAARCAVVVRAIAFSYKFKSLSDVTSVDQLQLKEEDLQRRKALPVQCCLCTARKTTCKDVLRREALPVRCLLYTARKKIRKDVGVLYEVAGT